MLVMTSCHIVIGLCPNQSRRRTDSNAALDYLSYHICCAAQVSLVVAVKLVVFPFSIRQETRLRRSLIVYFLATR